MRIVVKGIKWCDFWKNLTKSVSCSIYHDCVKQYSNAVETIKKVHLSLNYLDKKNPSPPFFETVLIKMQKNKISSKLFLLWNGDGEEGIEKLNTQGTCV